MGTLLYGNGSAGIQFADRALYHLQIVITAKLRRNEGFVFSWSDGPDAGSGRSTIWLSPSTLIHYRFLGNRVPAVNRAWIEQLLVSANSPGGLVYTDEPSSPTP